MNRIELTGRVSSDLTISETNSGHKFARFIIACPRNFKGADGKRTADYIPVCCWGNSADYAEKWAKKGEYALVTGWLGTWRRHTVRGDYGWCVNVQTIEILRATNEIVPPDPEDAMVMELVNTDGLRIAAWADEIDAEE
jgi:single-strand DNA-binding protein